MCAGAKCVPGPDVCRGQRCARVVAVAGNGPSGIGWWEDALARLRAALPSLWPCHPRDRDVSWAVSLPAPALDGRAPAGSPGWLGNASCSMGLLPPNAQPPPAPWGSLQGAEGSVRARLSQERPWSGDKIYPPAEQGLRGVRLSPSSLPPGEGTGGGRVESPLCRGIAAGGGMVPTACPWGAHCMPVAYSQRSRLRRGVLSVRQHPIQCLSVSGTRGQVSLQGPDFFPGTCSLHPSPPARLNPPISAPRITRTRGRQGCP